MVKITRYEAGRLLNAVSLAIGTLSDGARRTERSINTKFRQKPIEVTGYWVGSMMRIDIKL